MNIFALDMDPSQAARWHVDRHVVKMVLEYAQLLSTAHVILDDNEVGYRATHANHPSARWTRLGRSNYLWLYDLFRTTAEEYSYRYRREHTTWHKLGHVLSAPPVKIADNPFVTPFLAMPDEYKVTGDCVASYRQYYRDGKRHLHKWTGRSAPRWIEGELI